MTRRHGERTSPCRALGQQRYDEYDCRQRHHDAPPSRACGDSIIDDGVMCGVEFIADGWGPRPFEPQSGIGVYERGPGGKLVAARIYDDVDIDLDLRS